MSRALVVIRSEADRQLIETWARKAPALTRVTFQRAKRSLDQNSKLWAALTDIAQQKEHLGRRYTPDQWKVIFMHACGREVQFIPSLDSATFIPWGQSSSDLSRDEMSELLEFILAWGAQNGVVFGDE
jgi:hypothetical protein